MEDRLREEAGSLAEDILLLARKKLIIKMRFLSPAIGRLTLKAGDIPLATDGRCLYYDPMLILSLYREDPEKIMQAWLHVLLHCIFQHGSEGLGVDKRLWNIACDLAVETVITQMGAVRCQNEKLRQFIEEYSETVKMMTAEKLYHYFRKNPPPEGRLWELERYTSFDFHEGWYRSGGDHQKIADTWQEIARRIQTDIQDFGRGGGSDDMLLLNLEESSRDRFDYEAFLRQFARIGEEIKADEDTFDYIFYTYGLKEYGNMPLIEPLEYSDSRKLREFVIAIDTSGSVAGEQLKVFLEKTCRILMESSCFGEHVNVHVIQCDDRIRQDVKLSSLEEMENYTQNMQVSGFGGTDFRPVFAYVDELIRKKEFKNLQGLLYFTDGYGVFPSWVPSYRSAFIFVKDRYQIPKVPVWAMKLVLLPEELEKET